MDERRRDEPASEPDVLTADVAERGETVHRPRQVPSPVHSRTAADSTGGTLHPGADPRVRQQ